MKIVFIFGPQAVGKMTIGKRLSEKINVPLLFNHMTLDILTPFFGWSKDTFRISQNIRCEILETIADNGENPGIILTFGFYFDEPADWEIFRKYCDIFESRGIEICLVELTATLEERVSRNKTEYRLKMKPSKTDIEFSEWELLSSNEKHRLTSDDGEIEHPNYLKLDVTDLTVDEAVEKIRERFPL